MIWAHRKRGLNSRGSHALRFVFHVLRCSRSLVSAGKSARREEALQYAGDYWFQSFPLAPPRLNLIFETCLASWHVCQSGTLISKGSSVRHCGCSTVCVDYTDCDGSVISLTLSCIKQGGPARTLEGGQDRLCAPYRVRSTGNALPGPPRCRIVDTFGCTRSPPTHCMLRKN